MAEITSFPIETTPISDVEINEVPITDNAVTLTSSAFAYSVTGEYMLANLTYRVVATW